MSDIEQLKACIVPVLERYRVRRASLFGSYARGTETMESDIDILVELEDSLDLLDFIGLKQELEDVLGCSVDLVEYCTIKPNLKEQILSEQVAVL